MIHLMSRILFEIDQNDITKSEGIDCFNEQKPPVSLWASFGEPKFFGSYFTCAARRLLQ
jgi:hypothetical protein